MKQKAAHQRDMNGAGRKKIAVWRRVGCCGVWALQAIACACPAQTPAGTPAQPPKAMPAPPSGKTPTPSESSAQFEQNIPGLPANATLPVILNFKLWNNSLMEANIQINGALERCILDTGLNACAISPEAATRLKISPLPTQGTVTTLNETRTAPEAEFKNLQFNQLKFDSMRMLVINAADLYTPASSQESPSFWLGTPFLAAFQVTFDYTGQYISLDRLDAHLPKAKGAVTLPLEIRSGRLYTRVTIPKGGTFSALINTGTMGTLIPADIAVKLKIKPTQTFNVKWAGGKHGKASLITLPELQLKGLSQQQVPVLYFEPDGDVEVDRALGVLGADFLSHYKVIINIAHKKLTLIPPPPPKTDTNDADAPKPDAKPPTGKPKK